MKKILLGLFVFISCSAWAQSGDKNFIDQNYIEVTGKSEMEVVPDMIYLKVILNEKDKKNSISELEADMLKSLKGIGINVSSDVSIKDMFSNFKYFIFSKKDILVAKEYQILVHDGKTASLVLIELEKLGISNVSIDRLDHSKIVQYRHDVKIDAIRAAKEKAQALASAINQGIGRALYVQELNSKSFSSNRITLRGESSLSPEKTVPDVDFEKIKLEYSILCRFELK